MNHSFHMNSFTSNLLTSANFVSIKISRYTVLERNFKQKITAEEKATGISPDEPTDLEKALEEIVQKFEDIELLDNSKKVSAEKERQAAADMKQQCIEMFKETEKRKSDEVGGDNVRWRRISGNE